VLRINLVKSSSVTESSGNPVRTDLQNQKVHTPRAKTDAIAIAIAKIRKVALSKLSFLSALPGWSGLPESFLNLSLHIGNLLDPEGRFEM
jgi:hypothetical protein